MVDSSLHYYLCKFPLPVVIGHGKAWKIRSFSLYELDVRLLSRRGSLLSKGFRFPPWDLRLFCREAYGLDVLPGASFFLYGIKLHEACRLSLRLWDLLGVRCGVLPSVDEVDFFRAPRSVSSVPKSELEDRRGSRLLVSFLTSFSFSTELTTVKIPRTLASRWAFASFSHPCNATGGFICLWLSWTDFTRGESHLGEYGFVFRLVYLLGSRTVRNVETLHPFVCVPFARFRIRRNKVYFGAQT